MEEEKKDLTLEEAMVQREQVLMALAQNSVHNKRLLDWADELDRYIAYLQAQAKEAENQDEPKTDEPA